MIVTTLKLATLQAVLLCCWLLLAVNTEFANARVDGWIQNGANSGRGRNSDLGSYELQRDLIKTYDNLKFIPNSLVMPVYSLNLCGLSLDQASGQQVAVCIGRDGQMAPYSVKIPQEYALVDVLPVMDESFGYFTVRRNASNGVSFVLRSSVNEQSNRIFFDTKTNNQIQGMIITDYGLIVASGNFLVSVDRKTGTGNWIINLDGIQYGCQFLYDTSSAVPTLFVLYSSGIVAINPQNGMQLGATQSGFKVSLSTSQSFLTVGTDLLAIPEGGLNQRINIVDKNNLKRGIIASISLRGRNGNLDLNKCSNIISRDTNSLFLVCKNTDATFSALRYDATNNSISLGYEINTSSLFGIPPKVCSSQIAAYSKTGFYGLACDVGLISFRQDQVLVPRREIHIDIAPETQVFGTLGRFALITSANGKTVLEFVDTQ